MNAGLHRAMARLDEADGCSGLFSRMARTKMLALARGFHELDENFLPVRRGGQEEIHTRAVGAGARGGIERRQSEPRAQNFGRAVDIAHVNLDLLNPFAELLQVSRNRTGAAR